ncbi:MAG TPA: ABC transporter permease [Symbiobacteriaceae bacterium]|nr:ABC transporter permease [Symbiobacteriaceae bacterium]
MRTILLIARNSLVLAARDRKALVLTLLMPLILTAILGNALNGVMTEGSIGPATVLVRNADTGTLGKVLTEDVLGSAEVRKVLAASAMTDLERARADVAAGKATAAIYVPPSFSADTAAGRRTEIQVFTDPGDATRAAIVTQVVQGFTESLTSRAMAARLAGAEAMQPAPQPTLTETATGARPVSAMQYYAAAIALVFILTGTIQRGGKLLEERQGGTLQRMLVSPASRGEVLAGQVAGSALLALAQCAILMAGTRLLFGVVWGTWGGALLLGAAYSLAAAGIGTALAGSLRDKKAVDIASGALSNIFGLVSGALIPLWSFPDVLKAAAKLTPNYWAMQGFLDQMAGVGAARLWLPVTILAATAVLSGAFGTWRMAQQ